MKHYKQLLLSLLVCALFCGQFSIIASAGSDNLIDSDLRKWSNFNPEYSSVTQTGNYNGKSVYFISTRPEKVNDEINLKVSSIYKLPDFVSGNSYTFSFDLLSLEQVNSISYVSETSMYYGFKHCGGKLVVGLGSYSSSIDGVSIIEDSCVIIDSSNYLDYFGSNTKISFEVPNVVNPCICITYLEASGSPYPTYLFFSDVRLIDNNQVEEDSFFTRLFSWFQEKFDAIGDSFVNLGNEIKQGLIDLKNDLIDGIKSLFVPDEQFMEEYADKWEELIYSRLGAVAQVSGVLHDFFDSILAYSGSEQNIITVPAVTLSLPDNASFTFGGFDVEIVNEKFVFLQNAVKVLVGILATFGFIYGLRRRYDEVMGVEQ